MQYLNSLAAHVYNSQRSGGKLEARVVCLGQNPAGALWSNATSSTAAASPE